MADFGIVVQSWPDELTSVHLSLETLKESYSLYAALKITPKEFLTMLNHILDNYPTWGAFLKSPESAHILSKGYGSGIVYAYHNRI